MSSKVKIAITCAVLIGIAAVLRIITFGQPSLPTLTYSQFLDHVHSGQVASVVVIDSHSGAVKATCRLKDGKTVRTVLPSDYRDALAAMQDKLVNIEISSSSGPFWLLINAAPFFLLLGIWIFLMIFRFPNGPRRSAWG